MGSIRRREQHKLTILKLTDPQTAGWTQVVLDEEAYPNGATLRRLSTSSMQPLGYTQQGNKPQDATELSWSKQPGNIALTGPGTWWVFNQNDYTLEYVIEPVDDGQSLVPDETPMHGVATHSIGTTSAVANTATILLSPNRQRRSFGVWNRGATTIRIGRGYQPAANEGVPVFPGTYVGFGNGENNVDTIYVASSAVSQAYSVEETT